MEAPRLLKITEPPQIVLLLYDEMSVARCRVVFVVALIVIVINIIVIIFMVWLFGYFLFGCCAVV